MMATESKSVTFRLPPDVMESLEEAARRANQSVGVHARQLVIESLANEDANRTAGSSIEGFADLLRNGLGEVRADIGMLAVGLLVTVAKQDAATARAFVKRTIGRDAGQDNQEDGQ